MTRDELEAMSQEELAREIARCDEEKEALRRELMEQRERIQEMRRGAYMKAIKRLERLRNLPALGEVQREWDARKERMELARIVGEPGLKARKRGL